MIFNTCFILYISYFIPCMIIFNWEQYLSSPLNYPVKLRKVQRAEQIWAMIMSTVSFIFLSKYFMYSQNTLCIHKIVVYFPMHKGFPDSSVGKESACNSGDPSSIPGSGRSAGEEIGHPLQYSWVSLVAQLVKNPPAMQETSVWSLGWEDPLEKGKATHSSILAWRIPWTV